MNLKRLKILAFSISLVGIASNAFAITAGQVLEKDDEGPLGPVNFAVDFGSVSYVSDLSNGGLRFNRVEQTQGTLITTKTINITEKSNLLFDWTVIDNSLSNDFAYYQLLPDDPQFNVFHSGIGVTGNEFPAMGTVSRFLDPGTYNLQIGAALTNTNVDSYVLTVENLRIISEDSSRNNNVPDSSLGYLGLITILGLIGARRRLEFQ